MYCIHIYVYCLALFVVYKFVCVLVVISHSGLDSASALMVGRILKKLAMKKGITILCTIHQPRYALATMFDKLYFLAKGNEIYFGPTIPNCLTYFSKNGFTCPEFTNPADFLLDLVNTALDQSTTPSESINIQNDEQKNKPNTKIEIFKPSNDANNNDKQNAYKTDESENVAKIEGIASSLGVHNRDEIVQLLAEAYQTSDLRKQALEFQIPENENGDKVFASISKEFYITPWYNQFRVIFVRSFLHKFREPIALMTQAFTAIVVPLIFGSMYWQMDLSQQASLDRLSAIALLVLMLTFFAFDILYVSYLLSYDI